MGGGFFRRLSIFFARVGLGTLVVMLVMSEVLTGLSRLVHAIRARDSRAELEKKCKGDHVQKAFGHGADYNWLRKMGGSGGHKGSLHG
jgi:hypothetical protein